MLLIGFVGALFLPFKREANQNHIRGACPDARIGRLYS